MLINGRWKLSIFDDVIDQLTGKLLDWKLYFEVDYCSDGIQWSKLSTNSNSCERATIKNGEVISSSCNGDCGRHEIVNEMFTPRHSHTAIAVGNDVFVIGGHAHGIKQEIWRFNYEDRNWVQLHNSLERPKSYGQIATLTPYGMVAIGGLRNGVIGTSFTDKVFIYDILNETETVVDFDLE